MSTEFSFIILTLNEEQHLPRLVKSIAGLMADTFVLDSGSTDQTRSICNQYDVAVAYHPFENHPKQWVAALKLFPIKTPWVICLDADQVVTPELYQLLETFSNDEYLDIDGIYFNRKNIFKGRWIKHGGYYPFYLLKMFRFNIGYSDLNENMDHKFQVPGKTRIWKKGHIMEENLKENAVSFWIEKHNHYSDLLATEEIERRLHLRGQSIKPDLWGDPNARNAWLKRLWWKLPRYIRPFLYFGYRMLVQKGILDGKKGIVFHFLQGFWFRLIVDIKIEEKLHEIKQTDNAQPLVIKPKNKDVLRFAGLFPLLFLVLYYFNIGFIGLTSPGGLYIHFLDQHFNYIKYWREFNIAASATILKSFGYDVITNEFRLHVEGKAGFILVYSCLGYGILSLFSAFVLAYPKPIKEKLFFLLTGVITFQVLNTMRLILIALYWKPAPMLLKINSHEIFNSIIYLIIASSIYYWLNQKSIKTNPAYEHHSIKKRF
ncbi:exosortase Y [Pedobacter immunditicola]|uniref:exosortase Y n=1 Tax=Pedobacter immunditicola TaxID=3133440 RepID=UPI0030B25A89